MLFRRKFFILAATASLILSACSSARAAPAPQEENQAEGVQRTISVSGTGRVVLTPDMANISIGVQTEGESAATAVSENNEKAQAVMDGLESFGIASEDIRTLEFSVFPRQDRDSQGNVVGTLYIVRNTVQVTVRDLSQLGEVLDAVVDAGANTISGIQFDVGDRSQANETALGLAVDDAKGRAQVLAAAADVELGDVISIDAFTSSPIVPIQRVEAGLAAFDVPVSPGQLEITVDVNAVFEISS